MRFSYLVLTIIIFLSPSSDSFGSDKDIEKCDTYAADIYDTNKPYNIAGKKFEELNGELAVRYCSIAVSLHPSNNRMKYNLGRGLEKNKEFDKAAYIYEELSNNHDYMLAYNSLGFMYIENKFDKKIELKEKLSNQVKGLLLVAKCAEHHDSKCMKDMVFLLAGEVYPVLKNHDLMMKMANIGVKLGDPHAELALGIIYYYGYEDIEAVPYVGQKLLERSAKQGNKEAQNELIQIRKDDIEMGKNIFKFFGCSFFEVPDC